MIETFNWEPIIEDTDWALDLPETSPDNSILIYNEDSDSFVDMWNEFRDALSLPMYTRLMFFLNEGASSDAKISWQDVLDEWYGTNLKDFEDSEGLISFLGELETVK